MGRACYALACSTREDKYKKNGISFHRFPVEPERAQLWKQATGRIFFNPSPNSVLCSKHFVEADFVRDGMPRLKPAAVPSIYQITPNILDKIRQSSPAAVKRCHLTAISAFLHCKSPAQRCQLTKTFHCKSPGTPGQVANSSPHLLRRLQISSSPAKPTQRCQLMKTFHHCKSPGMPGQVANSSPHLLRRLLMSTSPITPLVGAKKSPARLSPLIASSSTVVQLAISTSPAIETKVQDHQYAVDSPRVLKRKLDVAMAKIKLLSQKLYNTRKREKRAKYSLSMLLHDKKCQALISQQCQQQLEAYKDLPLDLFKKRGNKEYTTLQRNFAITLHFYSAKAYEYLRKRLQLPCKQTVSQWLRNINGDPGFNVQALKTLQQLHKSTPSEYTLCTLMLDGMAIKAQVEWDQHTQTMIGFCDLGGGRAAAQQSIIATEVLALMAVGLLGHWKIAIGYFLITALSAETQQSIVTQALHELDDAGVTVVALTMDGLAANQAMAKNLGCSMDPTNLKSSFPNPACPGKEVYVIFDVCHCLKLMRGALHKYKTFLWPGEGLIEFKFFDDIVKLQEDSGLKAANKLTKRHVEFQRQKMKVKLAAQVFSRSVAKTLELGRELQLKEFVDSTTTQKFVELMDSLFDVLNSKSFHGGGMKYPITLNNIEQRRTFLISAINTLLSLQTAYGKMLLCNSQRHLAFVGFAFSSLSILSIAEQYLGSDVGEKKMTFLLTYKLSQDHLEIFFSSVRQACGANNNPTPKQFKYILKKLLFRAGISPSDSANMTPQDETSLLHITGSADRHMNRFDVAPLSSFEDHSYSAAASSMVLTPFVKSVTGYVAGWVVRKMLEKLKCTECATALTADSSVADPLSCALIRIKQYSTCGTGGFERLLNPC